MLSIPRHFRSFFWPRVLSCFDRRAESHFGTVEFTQFGLVKEGPVNFFIHLLKADLFVAEHFAAKHPAVTPTHIAIVAHPASEKTSGIGSSAPTRQHARAGYIDTARCLIPKTFV